jgi:hypothetical protein
LHSIHYSFRGVRKDGEVVDVEVLGNRTEIGGEPAVVGMVLDVTDRKRTAEMLSAGRLTSPHSSRTPGTSFMRSVRMATSGT